MGRGYVDLKIAVIARFGKRYFAANQKKRVQRGRSAASTFDSLAQVWGRPQCGFLISAPNGLPAENMARLSGSRKDARTPRRRLRSPRLCVPSFSVGIAIKKRTSQK